MKCSKGFLMAILRLGALYKQGEHHRFKRKASIRNNRGQRKAMYTDASLKAKPAPFTLNFKL